MFMRTKKAMLNIATSLGYQIILIISGLIVPKLILEAYGSACNGVVSSVIQFMSVISFLTIGLTGAIRVELYKALADNDTKQIAKIIIPIKQFMVIINQIL